MHQVSRKRMTLFGFQNDPSKKKRLAELILPTQTYNLSYRGSRKFNWSGALERPLQPRFGRHPTQAWTTVADLMVTSSSGRSEPLVDTAPIASTTLIDSGVACPNTVYCPSRKSWVPRQMKNWEPAELGSLERAIESVPAKCGVLLNSASTL